MAYDNVNNDSFLLTTFTVVDFDKAPIDEIYDICKNLPEYNDGLIVVASHQPDSNTKNTHYHTLIQINGTVQIPKDFPNKSKEEKQISRKLAKQFQHPGITRRSYERSEDVARYIHYITIKCLKWKSSNEDAVTPYTKCKWCFPNLCETCKPCNPVKSTDGVFEKIIKDIRRSHVCIQCSTRLCKKCYGESLPPCITDHFIDYYLSRGKCVPLGRVAEMLLSADVLLAPEDKSFENRAILQNALKAKQQQLLKIW